MVLSPGQIFDDTYRLIRFMGRGGMGVVYEATHARLAGRYAIKMLTAATSEARVRFRREARITSLLHHPNIVQVIDHNTLADGTDYLVMEYLDGESLGQRLFRRGSMDLDACTRMVGQIAAGLSAAHARGVVHRDLKPDNVFLTPVEGRVEDLVKILDFGISKIDEAGLEVSERALFGTPQYMAPEQIEGRHGDVDAATDQFALAVMTYEILTGRNPFHGDTVASVFFKVLHGHPAPTGLGRDVDKVLARGMAKANNHRFRSVTDFSAALAAANANPLHDTPASIAARSAPSPRSSRFERPEGPGLFESQARLRRRNWGLAFGAVIAAGISLSFVLEGAVPWRLAGVSPLAIAEAATPVPVAATDAVAAPSLVATSATPTAVRVPGPVVVPMPLPGPFGWFDDRFDADRAPAPARAAARARGRRGSSAAAQPRRRAAPASRPLDEDATLPLDESLLR